MLPRDKAGAAGQTRSYSGILNAFLPATVHNLQISYYSLLETRICLGRVCFYMFL